MNTLELAPPLTGTVAFPAPEYGRPLVLQKPGQRRGFDSTGDMYFTGRPVPGRVAHPLSWQQLPLTVKDDLLGILAQAHGQLYDLIWVDHEDITHTVRFMGQFSWTQVSPSSCRASLALEEQFSSVLLYEDNQALLDENNVAVTW